MFQLTETEMNSLVMSQIVTTKMNKKMAEVLDVTWNNIEIFEGEDFMLQLTVSEIDNLVMSQIATSRNNFFTGQFGGTRKLPYAFTEQGVYMLTMKEGEERIWKTLKKQLKKN